MREPGAGWRNLADDEGAMVWLRVPLGPGCMVTVLITREPSAKELDLLIRFLKVAVDDPARPLTPPAAASEKL